MNKLGQFRYPLDLSGRHPDNYVENETKVVSEVLRCISLNHGAYFVDSLRIQYNGQQLESGVHYRPRAMLDEAVKLTGKDIAQLIDIIDNNIQGQLFISYQVLGREYEDVSYNLDQMTANLNLRPTNIHWREIVGKPEQMLPEKHLHYWKDIYGAGPFYHLLAELIQTIKTRAIIDNSSVKARIGTLELKVDRFPDITQEDWDNLVHEFNDLNSREETHYQEVTTKLSEQKEAFDTLKAEYNAFADSTKTKLLNHETLINNLSTHVDNEVHRLDQAIDDLQKQIDKNPTYTLTKVQGRENEKTGLDYLTLAQEGKNFTLTLYPRTLDSEFDTRITNLSNRLDNHDTTLANHQTALDNQVTINQESAADRARIEREAKARDADLQHEISNTNTRLNEVNTKVDNNKESISNLEDQMNMAEGRLTREESRLTEHLSDYNQQVQNLNHEITSAKEDSITRDQALQAKIDENKHAIDDVNTRLDSGNSALQQELDKVNKALTDTASELNAKVDKTKEDLQANIDQQVSQVQTNLDQVDATLKDRLATQEEKINQAKDRLDTHDNQLASLSGAKENQAELIRQLQEKDVELANKLDDAKTALDNRITDVNARVSGLDTRLSNAERKLDNQKDRLDALGNHLHDIGNMAQDHVQEIQQLKAKDNELQNNLDNLTNKVNDEATKLSDLTAKQQEDAEKIAQLQNASSEANNGLAELEPKIEMMKTGLGMFGTRLQKDEQDILALNTSVDDLKNKAKALERIPEIQQEIDKIKEANQAAFYQGQFIPITTENNKVYLGVLSDQNPGLSQSTPTFVAYDINPTEPTSPYDTKKVMATFTEVSRGTVDNTLLTPQAQPGHIGQIKSLCRRQNNKDRLVIITTGKRSGPLLPASYDYEEYVDALQIWMNCLSTAFKEHVQGDETLSYNYLRQVFGKFIMTCDVSQCWFAIVFSAHGKISVGFGGQEVKDKQRLVYAPYRDGELPILRFEEEKYYEESVDHLMKRMLRDYMIRNNDRNLIENDVWYKNEEGIVDWKVLEDNWQRHLNYFSGDELMHPRYIKEHFNVNSESGLISLTGTSWWVLYWSKPIPLTLYGQPRLLEFSYTTNDPYREPFSVGLHKIYDEETDDPFASDSLYSGPSLRPGSRPGKVIETRVDYNPAIGGRREGPVKTMSRSIYPAKDGSFYRVKYLLEVPSVIPEGNYYLTLRITDPQNTDGVEVNDFCLTDYRGTNDHIRSKIDYSQNDVESRFGDKIRSIVRQYITENTDVAKTSRWDLSKFSIQPGTEDWSNVTLDENKELVAQGVILQKIDDSSTNSLIFAPTDTITVIENQNWRVPRDYAGRKARIVVRASSKRENGKVIHSAIRESYIVLPDHGTAIPIRIGALTSFGSYLSVNNNQDYPDSIAHRAYAIDNTELTGSVVIYV